MAFSLMLTGAWIYIICEFGCRRDDESAVSAEPVYLDGIFQEM